MNCVRRRPKSKREAELKSWHWGQWIQVGTIGVGWDYAVFCTPFPPPPNSLNDLLTRIGLKWNDKVCIASTEIALYDYKYGTRVEGDHTYQWVPPNPLLTAAKYDPDCDGASGIQIIASEQIKRMIEALPELLEACRLAREQIDDTKEKSCVGPVALMAILDAALAKAKGETR